jgi:hypothetical protein
VAGTELILGQPIDVERVTPRRRDERALDRPEL